LGGNFFKVGEWPQKKYNVPIPPPKNLSPQKALRAYQKKFFYRDMGFLKNKNVYALMGGLEKKRGSLNI